MISMNLGFNSTYNINQTSKKISFGLTSDKKIQTENEFKQLQIGQKVTLGVPVCLAGTFPTQALEEMEARDMHKLRRIEPHRGEITNINVKDITELGPFAHIREVEIDQNCNGKPCSVALYVDDQGNLSNSRGGYIKI